MPGRVCEQRVAVRLVLPGVVSIYLPYAFPASLLAAFVERPFLTAGGIDRRALVISLRANFLSAVIGLLLFPIGEPALYATGPLWCLAAFGISCIVEIVYVRRFSEGFRWGWAVAGNAASSFLLMVVPPFTLALKQQFPVKEGGPPNYVAKTARGQSGGAEHEEIREDREAAIGGMT